MANVPEHLLRRSAEAKAKATGVPFDQVWAEMTGGAAPAAAAAPAATATATVTTTAPVTATAPVAAAAAPAIPEGVRTQRLLTVVKARAIQQVKKEPTDKVHVWPHLLAVEFVALLVVLALLIVFSIFQDAPLLELANPNAQPNPSKAPWYFLGLQELLSYFDPQIAGVLIPGLGLAGLAIVPFIDRNRSTRPSDRKFAIMMFTFFVVAAAILTIIGSFYRGKGFNFTFPWRDGIFFDL
ncbi:MAG: menaquinol-cytochrome c reductase cytochrome b subunit [Acidimicrobiia bacterium]|nr:menaquinol-cytochrome c reductase cytochrome b subunit [Acidimicrobiia bacterium]